MKSFVAGLALVVPAAMAIPAFTAPIGTTSIAAGESFTATWADDGTAPTSETFGSGTIFLGIGGTVQQIKLASLGTVNFASDTSLDITIPATVGPSSSGQYFLRAESTATDPATKVPFVSFSAKFTLTGATGTFNATESSVAAGGSSSVSSTTSATSTTSRASSTTSKPSSSSSASRTTITSTVGPTNATKPSSGNMFAESSKPAMTLFGAIALTLGYLF